MQKHLAVALVTAFSVSSIIARPAIAERDAPLDTSDRGPAPQVAGQAAPGAQFHHVAPVASGGTVTTTVVNAAVQALNAAAGAETAMANQASQVASTSDASSRQDGAVQADAAQPSPASNAAGPSSGPVIQSGIATWYGPGFVGNVTYCGEIYDQWAMTAASNTLPCGSAIIVTNVNNGSSVSLRVTDRGGFGGSVILDLSQGAFDALGGPPAGTIPITVALAQ